MKPKVPKVRQKQPPEVFCKKSVLRNFTEFTGKHLCKSLSFNKVAGFRPATLLKERLWHRCCLVNFAKFLRTPLVAASGFIKEYSYMKHIPDFDSLQLTKNSVSKCITCQRAL